MVQAQIEGYTSTEQTCKPRNKPIYLWQIDFQQRCQKTYNGERIVFSTNGPETIYLQKMTLSSYFVQYIKINSKWIKGLHVRTKL